MEPNKILVKVNELVAKTKDMGGQAKMENQQVSIMACIKDMRYISATITNLIFEDIYLDTSCLGEFSVKASSYRPSRLENDQATIAVSYGNDITVPDRRLSDKEKLGTVRDDRMSTHEAPSAHAPGNFEFGDPIDVEPRSWNCYDVEANFMPIASEIGGSIIDVDSRNPSENKMDELGLNLDSFPAKAIKRAYYNDDPNAQDNQINMLKLIDGEKLAGCYPLSVLNIGNIKIGDWVKCEGTVTIVEPYTFFVAASIEKTAKPIMEQELISRENTDSQSRHNCENIKHATIKPLVLSQGVNSMTLKNIEDRCVIILEANKQRCTGLRTDEIASLIGQCPGGSGQVRKALEILANRGLIWRECNGSHESWQYLE